VVLAFAYGTHVVSVTDVIRQQAFPGFGRWVPALSSGGGLGAGLYGPALVLATLGAWPAGSAGPARDGYLVNCGAFASVAPGHSDWVWLRTSPWGGSGGRLGRVLAGPGQEMEWSDGQLRLGGKQQAVPQSWPPHGFPDDIVLSVPAGHVLVVPGTPGQGRAIEGSPVLVPCDEILGRAWARYYPVRQRQLLR
jgi:hypothetical protein